jgi:hypothetical protein
MFWFFYSAKKKIYRRKSWEVKTENFKVLLLSRVLENYVYEKKCYLLGTNILKINSRSPTVGTGILRLFVIPVMN